MSDVNPFVGSANQGYTFPGAVAPWGMVSVSPHNTTDSPLDYLKPSFSPSGYSAGQTTLYGLGLTHLSGAGCPELGAPVVMPVNDVSALTQADWKQAYGGEQASPGYYSAQLSNGISIEATATTRVAVMRFSFPKTGQDPHLFIDAGQNLSWAPVAGQIDTSVAGEISGSSQAGEFCLAGNLERIYFVARTNLSGLVTGTFSASGVHGPVTQSGAVGGYFSVPAGASVELYVGISYVSVDNARANLDAELGKNDFDQIRANTEQTWQDMLGRVTVTGGSLAQRRTFYTALYHSLLHPNVSSDVNGQYLAFGGGVATVSQGQRYSVFSLWDTYRSLHPLLELFYPERDHDMMRSLSDMTSEANMPPKWELFGSEVNPMVGDSVLPVLADAYVKGLIDFDLEPFYQIAKTAALDTTSATLHRPGNSFYRTLGYIPMEQANQNGVWGPVSTTLEYAYDDWAMALLASGLGHSDDASVFSAQAQSYATFYDASTGMLRPKMADGSFLSPFDANAVTGSRNEGVDPGGPGYVEGSAYNYAFFVPHDPNGVSGLHGGDNAYVAALQSIFDGGHYVMWNEPDLAYPFLFTHFAGGASHTQAATRQALSRFFNDGNAGLPGNDDTGAMSSWYVLAALGFYPDCPGSLRYSLTSPLFPKSQLTIGSAQLTLVANGAPALGYIKSVSLNGTNHDVSEILHGELVKGGELDFTMAATAQ